MNIQDFFTLFASYDFDGISNEGKCKSFDNWSELPIELKEIVISHMNHITRSRLSICSKSDYQIEKRSKLPIFALEIGERNERLRAFRSELMNFVSVLIGFDASAINYVKLRFVQDLDDKNLLHLFRKSNNMPTWKKVFSQKKHYKKAANDFVQRVLKKARYNIKLLGIEMIRLRQQSIFLKCIRNIERLRVDHNDYQVLSWFIQKTEGNLRGLGILSINKRRDIQALSSKFLGSIMPRIQRSESIFLDCWQRFSEEQFLNLKSKRIDIHIDDNSFITIKTINKFIKKWIKGELVDDFLKLKVTILDLYDFDEFFEGIQATKWNDEYEHRDTLFYQNFDKRYLVFEIKNAAQNKAATAQLTNHTILFTVTGILHCGKIFHRDPFQYDRKRTFLDDF